MPTARRMTTPPISERRPRVVRGSTTSSEKPHRFLIVLFGPRPLARAQPRRRWPDRGRRRNNRQVVRVGCVRRRAHDPNDDSGSRARRVTCDPAATPRHASPTQSAVRGLRGSPAQAVARRRARHVLTPRRSEYDLGVSDPDPVARHLHAARTHDQAAERHDEAARYWAERGDQVKADLEQRNAVIERDAAQLERDRAAAEQR